ncbi:carbonic anhydrase [Herminiimonas fonticola]|uniref:carbonic anhydrase n=2 Tax=Herminiimonas fonticola TaxID=303380 RepID=A0A4R6GJM7_9BURK|nr:Carbonic anhydrase [Herminiimonas fonticola]TDN94640.1 carbonic anhydrase [Herminiimonas fonticola]
MKQTSFSSRASLGAASRMMSTASVLFLSLTLFACAHQPSVGIAADPAVMTKAKQNQMTADQALQVLKDGNARFVSGNTVKRDLPAQVKATGHDGQFPLASIVSCIDSRSAPSQVFDQGVGDLFVASVAGNVVNEDILGSLEYASKVAGTKLIVILGHTHCGGVKGACDAVELGNLTQLVGKIRPAVNMTPDVHGSDRSSKNHHFVDEVAENNVKLQVKAVLDKSPVLRDMAQKGQIKVVGAMLDVETGKIRFF